MDELADSALHYGHVGRPVYLPETKTWAFARSFTQSPSITYTGETIKTIPSSCHAAQLQSPLKNSRQANDKLIPNAHPDFAAGWPSIRDDAFSKVVTSASNAYDPLVSSLLDLGYALDYASEAKAIPEPLAIAAVVTGESRNVISFRMLADDATELRHENSVIYVPSIGDKDTTEWSRWGHSILQICFARPVEGKSTWMAARLPNVTTVFRPIYHRSPVPMHIHDEDVAAVCGPLRNSRLDANPVVEVTKSSTGGFTHADVTFNPWYPRQFAIVDTRGNWTVWEVTGRQRRRNATWATTLVTCGSLPLLNEMLNNKLPRHDGWASVEWIVDFSTLLVSDRRSAMIFQMSGKDVRSSTVELGMTKQSEWVLDVQRSARDTSQFFVLTTSRLLWFDTITARLDQETVRLPLRPRLAWRHFRDPEDITLRLSDLCVNGDLYLVLYSRLAELIQVFPLPIMTDEQAELLSVPDPFILDVPLAGDGLFTEGSSSSPYSTFVFREIGHTPAPRLKNRYNPNMTLIKLFWVDPSLAVYETLFKGPDGHRVYNEEGLPVDDRDILHAKRHFVQRKERDLDEEQFVVDDWDESVAISGVNRYQPVDAFSSPDLPWNADPQWALNWSSIYALVVTNLATVANQGDGEGPPFTLKDLIKDAENDLFETFADFQTSETMLELGGRRPVLDDIDDGADDLSRLVSIISSQSPSGTQASCRHIILPLQFSKLFYGMPPAGLGLDFLETYNALVDEWVTSVPHGPHGIPNQTRVLKEKTARAVALDLLLSRLIRVSNAPIDKRASQGAGMVDSGRAETECVISFQEATSLQPASSQNHSRPIQATTGRSFKSAASETSASTYSNLSTYTTFKEPRQMPRNVANLLSHWQMGSDPSTYVWSKTSQLLEDEEAQRTPGPSTPRHRIRKKRSQLTPAPDASSLPPTPVAPLVRTWGTQPDNPMAKVSLPSSQPTVDEVPMTQMERGQFGAREAKKSSKSKKKRRAAGF